MRQELVLPDIPNDAEVVEVLIAEGDTIAIDDPILIAESDKATIEAPSPLAGVVAEVSVKVGDSGLTGKALAIVEVSADVAANTAANKATAAPVNTPAPSEHSAPETPKDTPSQSTPAVAATTQHTPDSTALGENAYDVCVIGAGPGGYTAAFRAADLGLRVVLIDKNADLGGVCLNVGCIPSKALLHIAEVISAAKTSAKMGIAFGEPTIDLALLRKHKDKVIKTLTQGLKGLAKGRKVDVVRAEATFLDAHHVKAGDTTVAFKNAIIACGSEPIRLPFAPNDDARIWDSTAALELTSIPKRLLVVGGGIIGLEMACVYHALGSQISVVERAPQLVPEADKDLVDVLMSAIKGDYENIWLNGSVTAMTAQKKGIKVAFDNCPKSDDTFDAVLVAVGRRADAARLGVDKAGVAVEANGTLTVDAQRRTNIGHIYAIGDVTGNPMLAHKATHEAKVAAETIAGEKVGFDAMTIPGVAYTHPEIAWMGKTEKQLKAENIEYETGAFPWAASGRNLSLGEKRGLTKAMFAKDDGRLLGAGIVGAHADELIAEAVLALEMGATAEDIALSIHPHPTLSETFAFAAEAKLKSLTDLMN